MIIKQELTKKNNKKAPAGDFRSNGHLAQCTHVNSTLCKKKQKQNQHCGTEDDGSNLKFTQYYLMRPTEKEAKSRESKQQNITVSDYSPDAFDVHFTDQSV